MSVYDNTKLYLPLALLPNGKKSIMNMDNNVELGRWIKDRIADGTIPVVAGSVAWSAVTGTPTTLTGYGITDGLSTSTSYSGDVTGTYNTMSVNWSNGTTTYDGLYYPLSTNPANYLTSITSSDVTTALGYTPYDAANPAGYITSATAASTYVPLTRTITINGITYDLSANRSWTIATSSSGVCGISNASGVYTFYPTLQDACTAVNTGETIEVFADIALSAGVTLTKSCCINLNGHTVSLSHATQSVFTFTLTSGVLKLFNGGFTLSGSGTGSALLVTNSSSTILCSSFILTTTSLSINSAAYKNTGGGSGTLYNATCISNTGAPAVNSVSNGDEFYNCVITNTSTGNAVAAQSRLFNCVLRSTSGVACTTVDYIYNCTIYSASGTSTLTAPGSATLIIQNSSIINLGSGVCINSAPSGLNCLNVSFRSNSGSCVTTVGYYRNCSFYSTSANATMAMPTSTNTNLEVTNCSIVNTLGQAINLTISGGGAGAFLNNKITNCYIKTFWNNASGHAVYFNIIAGYSGFIFTHNDIEVANSSANVLNAANSMTVKMVDNIYKGTTTFANANITPEAIVSTDAYGNKAI